MVPQSRSRPLQLGGSLRIAIITNSIVMSHVHLLLRGMMMLFRRRRCRLRGAVQSVIYFPLTDRWACECPGRLALWGRKIKQHFMQMRY